MLIACESCNELYEASSEDAFMPVRRCLSCHLKAMYGEKKCREAEDAILADAMGFDIANLNWDFYPCGHTDESRFERESARTLGIDPASDPIAARNAEDDAGDRYEFDNRPSRYELE